MDKVYRCGLTDASFAREFLPRWGKRLLRWHLQRPLPGMNAELQGSVLADAFSGWEAICGVRFEHTSAERQAEIVIGCGRGKRADFDGAGGTLAWAYLPSSSAFDGQLMLMFDQDEDWREIQLLNVAAHEIGHNLGISHGPTGCLMAAVYSPAIARPQAWDISEATRRYGRPEATKPNPPPQPPAPSSSVPNKVAVEIDGRIFVAQTFREVKPASSVIAAPWLAE